MCNFKISVVMQKQLLSVISIKLTRNAPLLIRDCCLSFFTLNKQGTFMINRLFIISMLGDMI